MTNLIKIFTNPTPNQFFYLMISHIIIFVFLGYFFLSTVVFIVAVGSLFPIFFIGLSIYRLEIVRSTQKLRKLQWVFLSTLLIILIFSMEQTFDKVVFRQELAISKSQLKTVSGVIQGRGVLEYGGEKNRRATYHLIIGNISFLHCRENIRDDCDKTYSHRGKIATAYYLPTYTTGNVVYEIIVDNQIIYDFDAQLKLFKKERRQVNMEIFWVLILFVLPLFYFFKVYYRAILQIPEMSDEEKIAYDIQEHQAESEQIQKEDFGNCGEFIVTAGALIVFCGIVLAVLTYHNKKISYFITTILLFVLGGLLIYLVVFFAKKNRDIRLKRHK